MEDLQYIVKEIQAGPLWKRLISKRTPRLWPIRLFRASLLRACLTHSS